MTARMLLTSLRLVALFTVVVGIGYVFGVAGFAHLLFPASAQGSMVTYRGRVVGSKLIGQEFTSPGFFQGRPSATTPAYNAASSASSNLGPSNPKLLAHVKSRIRALERENPGLSSRSIPPDMVESSASGLDPDIPVAGAMIQAPRVARADHLSQAAVRGLIDAHVTQPFLGIFGQPYVNVLELNIGLLGLMRS